MRPIFIANNKIVVYVVNNMSVTDCVDFSPNSFQPTINDLFSTSPDFTEVYEHYHSKNNYKN